MLGKKKPLYFQHLNVSDISIHVNGTAAYNIKTEFPHKYSQLYYATLSSLGLEKDHLLSYEDFAKGRTVAVFSFVPEQLHDTVPVQKEANLRVEVNLRSPDSNNNVILLFGETHGMIRVNYDRSVLVDVRA